MKNLKILALTAFAITTFISCEKDDETPVNEEEVITTVIVTLKNGADTITLISRDLDGDGPNTPVETVEGIFKNNTTYNGSIEFKNETTNPVENITEEILEEKDEHQIFYKALPSALGVFTYLDKDSNNKPVGLEFKYTTSGAATGKLLFTLKHEPNKSATGVEVGDITNAGGATDAEVDFDVLVK